MSQTSSIAFALIVGFIVFVTVRGELPEYLGVIGIGGSASSSLGAASTVATVAPTIIKELPELLS